MPSKTPSYSSAKFMLEIDHKAAGFLLSVEGGEPLAEVVSEPADANGVVRKHVGTLTFSPIRISFGIGMSKPLYQWMADVLNRKASAKNGAILFVDYNFKEQSRLEFDNALITEVALPALDARSKGRVQFTLTLQPGTTRISKASSGNSVLGFGTKTQQVAGTANFRLNITGLETACIRVNMIDAIIVKQPTIKAVRGGVTSDVLNVPNVFFTLAESHAQEAYDWFADFVLKGNNAAGNERTGTLELFDANWKSALFTLTLANLGILRIQKERSIGGADVNARVRVEIYCEEMAFNSAGASAGSVVTSLPSEIPSIGSSTSSVNARLTETLVGILADRIREEDTLRTTSRSIGSPRTVIWKEAAESELIARRLQATVRPVAAGPLVSKRRDDGILTGERWATEKATLQELELVAAIESGEWTAMRLENEHSLIVQLCEAGVIPPGGDGPLDLERDDFVEGIVAGASAVLRSATPHLTGMASQK